MNKSIKWGVGITLGLLIVFCASFIYFSNRAQSQISPEQSPALSKPLPEAHLVDLSDTVLEDPALRRGKVVLVFITPECPPCKTEAEFLSGVVRMRDDVKFYGVVPYGEKKTALEAAEKIFPFKVFYDDGFHLAGQLGINRLPIKIFVEDGVIKKVWGGATNKDQAKAAFTEWLRGA
jgi:thiol-disulfide isomerase/thioredoxin